MVYRFRIGERNQLFNLSEAQRVLPLVQKLTADHHSRLQPLQLRLNRMLASDPRRKLMEKQFEQIVNRWRSQLEKLGVIAAGLWVVEFDVGEGFLSWHHPERHLSFFRAKDAKSGVRERLQVYIDTFDPDWAY